MIASKALAARTPALRVFRQSTFNTVRVAAVSQGRTYMTKRTTETTLQETIQQRRTFSQSPNSLTKTENNVFLAPADKDTPHIAKTETSWPHPMYAVSTNYRIYN
jgi:hypothetical protein